MHRSATDLDISDFELNVVAMHAGASAAAWTCGGSVAIDDVEVTATALAKAVAEAYANAYAGCSADEGGTVCADAGSSVKVWVEAVVRSWAGAWAGAYTCTDTCTVEIDVVVDAVTHIMVDAAASAYSSVCSDGALLYPPFPLPPCNCYIVPHKNFQKELYVETNSVSCVCLECVKQVVAARMSMLVLW
jgi:hypothetical protein